MEYVADSGEILFELGYSIMEHPELMEGEPLFQKYREIYKKADDVFFY